MVSPVVMYGCESWTVKKAERRRMDAFELWCWRRLSRVPCTARRSNQSILKEIALGFLWKEWCWSWNSSTLATSCEELTHWKNSDAGRDWGQEEKGTTEDEMAGWHHQLDGHEFEWTLPMRWPKYWSFSFNIIPSKEIPGLISFRMDWLVFLAVQGLLIFKY